MATMGQTRRVDSVSLAGMAIFGALAVVLTLVSQALGLYFPLVPYLQFDLGEIAILLAFFIFGPLPALVAAFIEFATLMALGVNAAFFGPEFKLIAILSSLLGIWLGAKVALRARSRNVGTAVGFGGGLGMVLRAAAMTLPNYLLIVSPLFGLTAALYTVQAPFKDIGISVTSSNVLALILTMTAIFNAIQFGLVTFATYAIVSLPQVRNMRVAGRRLWIVAYLQKGEKTLTSPLSVAPEAASR